MATQMTARYKHFYNSEKFQISSLGLSDCFSFFRLLQVPGKRHTHLKIRALL